mgnify:CR=1 FL=1|tara:strand:+ start:142 stop:618 length:477 start_codon:yes stop_codon:yes gene_type:complete
MIIACENCNKKFDVDENLIPEKGRLIQCSSCDHKWFFKNEILAKTTDTSNNVVMEIFDNKSSQEEKFLGQDNRINIKNNENVLLSEIVKKDEINKTKINKRTNFLNLIIVFMISFIALILILDTFVELLIKIFPNLETLLYNLYESIHDIKLFIKDLI